MAEKLFGKTAVGEDIELVIDGRIGQSRIYQHDTNSVGLIRNITEWRPCTL